MEAMLRLVREGRARTRGEIGEALSMRSSSVSDLVGELVAAEFLREAVVKPRGRGRPVGALSFNAQRLGAILLTVMDQRIVAQAVDLDYHVLSTIGAEPDTDADNAMITKTISRLVREAAGTFPVGIEICAIVASLSGLLDVPRMLWCVSSRWPRLSNLDLRAALAEFPWPVTMLRNLDAELAGALLRDGGWAQENVLLLHWGHGIGASYAARSGVINLDRGRFCEIGHWQLGNGRQRPCTCGNLDCLETVAALWAIGDEIRARFPELPREETGLAEALRHVAIAGVPVIDDALQHVLRLMANLCRLLFPDRVLLTGPFVQHPEIFRQFVDTLVDAPLMKSLDPVRVATLPMEQNFERPGALVQPFSRAIRRHLAGATR
ncbi:MAG: ROK family protein [Pseudorhodobacter sp.]